MTVLSEISTGIDVTAMHNHMLFDEPHLYFMHFWANDDAVKLAHGLRAALDETNSQKPQPKVPGHVVGITNLVSETVLYGCAFLHFHPDEVGAGAYVLASAVSARS